MTRHLFTFRLGDALVERDGDAHDARRRVDLEKLRRRAGSFDEDKSRQRSVGIAGRTVGRQAVNAGTDGRGGREQQLHRRRGVVRRQHEAAPT